MSKCAIREVQLTRRNAVPRGPRHTSHSELTVRAATKHNAIRSELPRIHCQMASERGCARWLKRVGQIPWISELKSLTHVTGFFTLLSQTSLHPCHFVRSTTLLVDSLFCVWFSGKSSLQAGRETSPAKFQETCRKLRQESSKEK